jgi:hypothetical protein
LLLDHTISINYKFITKFAYSVWEQVKEGDLARVITADGRRTWHETPKTMFCDVPKKEVPKEYRPIFGEMKRRGLIKLAKDDAGRRAWFPTALGKKRGLGASGGSAFKLLRDLGYDLSERDVGSRLCPP